MPLCGILPVKHVAESYGLSWDAVKAIDQVHLTESLGPADLSGVEVIAMDEFAIQKGHRYAYRDSRELVQPLRAAARR
jgi:transposase